PVTCGLDRDEMHGERVAGLGALDVERAGLRVQVRELADLGHQVVLAADLAGEAVLGEHLQDHRRPDPGHRGRTAERPGVLAGVRPERDDLGVTHFMASLAGASLASGGGSSPPGHRNGAGAPYAVFGPAAAA